MTETINDIKPTNLGIDGYNKKLDDKTLKRNKIIVHSVAGSAASLAMQLLHPFDILKVRFQSNDGGRDSRNLVPKYHSLINSIKTISKSEGNSAFFKGVLLSILGNNLSYG